MDFQMDRRSMLKAGAAVAATCALPALAQAKPTIRFAAVFSEKDIRADMIRNFAKDIAGDFNLEPFFGGTLFKQGTELVALQRDNLELGNIAPQDISKQVPAWSILTSAYLFRDANHLNAFFASDLRRADEEDGRGSGEGEDSRPDVLRHPAARAQAEEKDRDARGPGRRQVENAARGRLAAPRTLARRQSHAHGLRRGLHGPADRGDRRAGQPAAQCPEHEVLRGDVADRADFAPGRLRPPHGQPEDLDRHAARPAESFPGCGGQGDQLERRRASEAGGWNWPISSGSTASRSTSRT